MTLHNFYDKMIKLGQGSQARLFSYRILFTDHLIVKTLSLAGPNGRAPRYAGKTANHCSEKKKLDEIKGHTALVLAYFGLSADLFI